MFNWPTTGMPELDLRSAALREEEDRANQRSWFDRVLAPFEAPQQFLFSLTQSVAEDGFQWGDVGDAFSHGARYFNPFSNQERIGESEIADIFFGEGRKRDGATGFFTELGISLLYDPLWFSAGAKAARAPANVVRGVERISNPASLGLEGIVQAGRAGQILTNKLGTAALGATRWNDLSYRVAATVVPPSRLIDAEYFEPLARIQTNVQESHMRMAPVVKYVREVGKDADTMLMKALTNSEIGLAVERGTSANARQRAALRTITDELESKGMDKERFFEALQVYKDENHLIETSLLAQGHVTGEAAAQMAHRYLRNVVNFKQSPTDMQRRLDQLIQRTKGKDEFKGLYKSQRIFHEVELREQLTKAAEELGSAATERGRLFQAENILPSAPQRRYFPRVQGDPKSRRFNVDAFMDDLTENFDSIERMSVNQAMGFIDENLMGGIEMPSSFRAVLADYLAKGQVDTQTIPQWQEWLGRGRASGQVSFRSFAENVDVVKNRNAIPDELLYDVLGASTHALPRMVEGVAEGGRLAAITTAFDELSGAERLSAESVDFVKRRLERAYNRGARQVPESSVGATRNPAVAYPDETPLPRGRASLDSILDEAIEQMEAGEAAASEASWAAYGRRAAQAASPNAFRDAIRNTEEYARGVRESVDELAKAFPDMKPKELESLVRRIEEGNVSPGSVVRYGDGVAERPKINKATGMIENLTPGKVRIEDSESWGSLAGSIVPVQVYRHLSQYTRIKSQGEALGSENMWTAMGDWAASVTSAFKYAKIAADAGAHIRDFVGSLIQMDVMGMNTFKTGTWRKAVDVVKRAQNGEIDDYVRSAHDVGFNLFGSTLAGTELGRAAARATDTVYAGPKLDWLDETRSVFQNALDGIQRVGGRAADMYQFRESVLRTYTYVNKYDELMEAAARAGTEMTLDLSQNIARQAAEFTNKTLFNYADVSLGMEFVRRYGIAPFITFPAKAVGQMADVLYNNPLRILKYDRTVDAWNNNWAGGDEEFAREIEALPEYQRQSMVARLPWENADGEAMYVDLSYFIPWAAVRDLSEDVFGMATSMLGMGVDASDPEDPTVRGSYPGATSGGGVFSPIVSQLVSPIVTGKDSLGREIYDETSSTEDKVAAIARHLYQFFAPPTFIGGSTADSVGRALVAASRNSPEPVRWTEFLGLGMRTGFKQDDILNRYGEGPVTRALPTSTDNPFGQAGLSLASLFAPVSISNPERAVRNEGLGVEALESQIERRMQQVASNPNLTEAERERRIARLRAIINARAEEFRQYRSFLFQ